MTVFVVGPEAYDRDEGFRREVAVHLESSLEAMIDAAERVGTKVLLIAPASNLTDFAPFKSEHPDGLTPDRLRAWIEHYERGIALQKSGDHAGAAAALEAAGAIDDRFAMLAFLLGRPQLALGRTEAAKASFEKAREEDLCPFRAIEEAEAIERAEGRVREAREGPRYARELYALSGLLDSLGRFEQALGRVGEGLELSRATPRGIS